MPQWTALAKFIVADQFDQSQETEALHIAAALAAQARRVAPVVLHDGYCKNPLCGEPVEAPKLFCDAKCAAQHAKRSK